MNDLKEEQVLETIEQCATAWYVRHREGGLGSQEQQQFLRWLRASPRHVEAYLNLTGLTDKLPEALSGMNLDAEALIGRVSLSPGKTREALFAPQLETIIPPPKRARQVALAATVLLLLTTGLVWLGRTWVSVKAISVPAGEQRMVTLEDGSVARLNANTRMIVRYSDMQRLIELPSGQALFSVVHDARRPFIVRSGQMDVVAVGTQFDVYRKARQTRVTVVEGKVEIVAENPQGQQAPMPLRLVAGEQARMRDSSSFTSPQTARVDVRQVTAWTRSEVAFAGERLESVATQFNRNAGARIIIEDPQLKDYRVSGVFQGYDLDSFVAYLRQFEGIVVEQRGEEIRIRNQNYSRQ